MTIQPPPLLSVIALVHNTGSALERSIGSILNHIYPNLELLIIDDGSSDDSERIYRRFGDSDARVRIFGQPNRGFSAMRNEGIQLARGEYLAFVDADDQIDPNTYAVAMSHLLDCSADIAAFVMTFCYVRNTRIQSVQTLCTNEAILMRRGWDAFPFFALYDKNYLPSVCNKIFRTTFIRENAYQFNPEVAVLDDLTFSLIALSAADCFVAIPGAFYCYRVSLESNSLGRRRKVDYLRNFQEVVTALENFADVIGLIDQSSRERLAGMIFRYYILGTQWIIQQPAGSERRFGEFRTYMRSSQVAAATQRARKLPFSLTVIRWLRDHEIYRALYVVMKLGSARRTIRNIFRNGSPQMLSRGIQRSLQSRQILS